MDMPVPSIAEWEWVNWKFPRQVRAGETVYARWTLTQKRPVKAGDPAAIAVWRVDVHTADGALCAEGEVGASVTRSGRREAAGSPPAPQGPSTAPSRRRRGRKSPAKPPSLAAEPAPKAPEPAMASTPAEKTTGSRRRRRRRPKSGHGNNGQPATEAGPEPPPAVAEAAGSPPAATTSGQSRGQAASPLSRVIKRLRRPSGG